MTSFRLPQDVGAEVPHGGCEIAHAPFEFGLLAGVYPTVARALRVVNGLHGLDEDGNRQDRDRDDEPVARSQRSCNPGREECQAGKGEHEPARLYVRQQVEIPVVLEDAL